MSLFKARPRGKRSKAGVLLPLLAGIFATSALLRLGGEANSAFAFALPADCAMDPGNAALMTALKDREAKLNDREAVIADRSQALKLAEKTIDDRLTALRKAEDDLSKTVTFADSAAENDITRLVAVYENMKPKDAAPLFEAMDPEFAAGFLSRMRPASAAAVMASLDPKFAYSVSAIVAGRNASAPKN